MNKNVSVSKENKDIQQNIAYMHPYVKAGKWLVDKIAAIFGLCIMLILFPFIATAIRLDSKGPVLFKQLRVGRAWPYYTELITVFKFRTMYTNAEANGLAVWAKKNDSRITKIGQWLRRTRLDELPQFINILRGEMSLIGPRPERPSFINYLEKEIPFYIERFYGITPGLTGYAQVYLGYDNDIADVRKKVAYDHAYALALSKPTTWLSTDLTIILQTLKVILLRRGQ